MASDPQTLPPSAEDIADRFEYLASVSQLFERELAAIGQSRVPLSETTVRRLAALVGEMEPAAKVRADLAQLPPPLLMAGVRAWVTRQELAASALTPVTSAVRRAQQLWTGGR